MQKFNLLFRKKLLPATIAAIFLGSTLFFTSAAAQRLLLTARTKASASQSGQSKLVLESGNPTLKKEPAAGNTSGPAITAQAASVVAASSGLAAQGGLGTQNSNPQAIQPQLAVSASVSGSAGNSGNVFTLAMLAQHNKSGDCYIAYQGKVYDLSQAAVWANCQHHGVTGGIDVTALFPHPVSYFNGIPVVGVLASGTVSSQGGSAAAGQTQATSSVASDSMAASASWEDDENRELEAEHSNSSRTRIQTDDSGPESDD